MSTSTSYINHGDHLPQLSTSVSVGKVQFKTVSGYLKLGFFGGCTTRRTWTLLIFCGKILYIKLSAKMPRRAMRCTTPDSQRIKLVSRHQNRQQFDAILPVELTSEDIRNSAAYKEYYAIASGAAPPKTKASVRKTQSSSDTTMPPPTAASTRLSTSAKEKQPAKSSKAKGLSMLSEVALTKAEQMKLATKRSLQQTHLSQASGSGADEGTGIIPGVPDVPTDESGEEISWKSSDEDDDDDVDDQKEGLDTEDDEEELYRDVNINLKGRDVQMTDVHTTQVLEDTHVTLTPVNPDGQQQSSSVSSHCASSNDCTNSSSTIHSYHVTNSTSTSSYTNNCSKHISTGSSKFWLFVRVYHRLKTLEANFFELMHTNQFAEAVSSIPEIVDRYIDHRMNEDVKVAVQLQSDRLRDEAQAENEDFINKLDENIQKIIKEQMNKGISTKLWSMLMNVTRSFWTHMETNRGSKRRREGKEPEPTSAPKEKASKTNGKSTEGSKSHHKTASESAPAEEPMQTTQDLEEPSHQEFETSAADDQPIAEVSQHPEWFQKQTKPPIPDHTLTPELLAGPTYELMKGSYKSLVELEFFLEEVYKATTDQLDCNNPEGQQYPHNLLKPLPLIPNSRGRRVIPFDHFINNDLEYLRGGASSRKYTTSITKTKAADYGHIKWIEDLVPCTMWSQTPVSYDKYALWRISHWGRKRQQFYGL
nr:hypothetical protein [Tanacetum cinerariifolium]